MPNQLNHSGPPRKSKKVFTCASNPRTCPLPELIGARTRTGKPPSSPEMNAEGVTKPSSSRLKAAIEAKPVREKYHSKLASRLSDLRSLRFGLPPVAPTSQITTA